MYITWITWVETIKRQTRVAYGWMVVGQPMGAGLAYGLYGCTSAVCDMNSAAAAAVLREWVFLSFNNSRPRKHNLVLSCTIK